MRAQVNREEEKVVRKGEVDGHLLCRIFCMRDNSKLDRLAPWVWNAFKPSIRDQFRKKDRGIHVAAKATGPFPFEVEPEVACSRVAQPSHRSSALHRFPQP